MTQFLGLKGIQLDCDAAGRQLLCKHFLNAYTEGLQHQRRRSQGEIVIGAEIAADASTFQVTAAPTDAWRRASASCSMSVRC